MVIFAWIATCVIWSTVWLAIKIGVDQVPPFGFAVWRLAVAWLVVGPLALRRRQVLSRDDTVLIAQTGALLLGANYALLYWGAQFISSGLMATLQATTPIFAVGIGHVLAPHERTTRAELAALALGVAGVALVFWPDLVLARLEALYGAAAAVTGACCVAWAYVRVRQHARHVDTVTLMAGQMLAGLCVLLPLAVVFEGNPLAVAWTATTVAALLYLVIAGSLAAFWLNYWLLARMRVRQVLLMAVVEPLLAVLLGALVLGERMSLLAVAGAVLIVTATYFTLRADAHA